MEIMWRSEGEEETWLVDWVDKNEITFKEKVFPFFSIFSTMLLQ